MSIEAILAVMRDHRLRPTDRYILMFLAQYAHSDGTNAFPFHQTLAEEADVSVVAVTRAIGRGVQLGRVTRNGKREIKGRSADRWPTNYSIDLSPQIGRSDTAADDNGVSPPIGRVSNEVSRQSERPIPTDHRGVSPQIGISVKGNVKESSSSDETISQAFAVIADRRMAQVAGVRNLRSYRTSVLTSIRREHSAHAEQVIDANPEIDSEQLASLLEPTGSEVNSGVRSEDRCGACGEPLSGSSRKNSQHGPLHLDCYEPDTDC